MQQTTLKLLIVLLCVGNALTPAHVVAQDKELSQEVLTAIQRAQKLIVEEQKKNSDGSWGKDTERYHVGISALAHLALVSSQMTVDDPAIQKSLTFLRKSNPRMTYEIAMVIMALATTNDGGRDTSQIFRLADKLEKMQLKTGENAGLWDYDGSGGGDRSNGQFAVLGLRDAVNMGYPAKRKTWELIRRHWERTQQANGGWGYSSSQPQSKGSMTVAGVATLTITNTMLRDTNQLNPDGTPVCCGKNETDEALERGIKWIENSFTVGHNPSGKGWLLYYLYGLERAGRLTGKRFFGDHDWYRAGARSLVDRQAFKGQFQAVSGFESDPVIGTSLALLFLSKGLSPVLINKLEYGKTGPDPLKTVSLDWNHHPRDARNLTELISGRPKWPKLLTSQVVNIHKLKGDAGVTELRQAPVTLMTGAEAPVVTDDQVEMLSQYLEQGGFLFAVGNCNRRDFEEGFRSLVQRLYPDGDAELKPLPADHPVYRSEFLLEQDSVELYGVDVGCRTSIIFCPDDLSCLWDKWVRTTLPGQDNVAALNLRTQVARATRIGVNVIAYATGREPPGKLDIEEGPSQKAREDKIQRGMLRIAKLRHSGGWDTAPHALRNLLIALNQIESTRASTQKFNIPINDQIGRYPIVYMHGRYQFSVNQVERERLAKHLSLGGVMFADSCCGAREFDKSFREFIKQLYPDHKLKRIPVDHELFSTKIGHDLKQVKRRVNRGIGAKANLDTEVEVGEPFLEGIEIDGRYVVIYSKYDISCALERQSTAACEGYLQDDAFRIAHNIVMYAMLQER